MHMTMLAVIPVVLLSSFVSLFISYKFFRNRMKTGLAVIVLLPTLSCSAYVYLTLPRAPSPLPTHELLEPSLFDQFAYRNDPSKSPAVKDLDNLWNLVVENHEDLDAVLILSNAYMNREDYDSAITLLKESKKHFPEDEKLTVTLTTAYFAKGLFLAEQKDYEEALKNLQLARKIAPEDAPFLMDLQIFIAIVEGKIAEKER